MARLYCKPESLSGSKGCIEMTNVEQKDSLNDLSFASEEFDNEKYSRVANSARLLDVCLVKQNYHVKLNLIWTADGDSLKHRFRGEPKGHSFDPDGGTVIGGYEWQAEIKVGRKNALKLTGEYLLVYGGLENQNEEYVRLYFNKLARFTTYPYFRALFSMSTSNSGLALDPLPSLIDRPD